MIEFINILLLVIQIMKLDHLCLKYLEDKIIIKKENICFLVIWILIGLKIIQIILLIIYKLVQVDNILKNMISLCLWVIWLMI